MNRSPIFNTDVTSVDAETPVVLRNMSFSNSTKKILPFSIIKRKHKVDRNVQSFAMPTDLSIQSKGIKILHSS